MKPEAVTRAEFIRRLRHDCGLDYRKSCEVYDCVVATLEDAVVAGAKVNFGRLGALTPVWKNAKVVNMGFERLEGDQVRKRQRTYFLGRRIRYKFNIYKEFINKHALNWFS